MTSYKGKSTTVHFSAEETFNRLSDLSRLQSLIDGLPEELRSKMGGVSFTPDEIVVSTPQMGDVKMTVVERTAPSRIKFAAQQSPVPIALAIDITPESDDSAAVSASIEAEVPAMLRPLVGSKLQEAADKFGDVVTMLLRV